MADRVEIVVVGRGMIGSAAARHLAEAGVSVAVIGEDEPADPTLGNGPFASFWDQGRITRLAARDRMWATIARRSIDRYADIEQRSGMQFHTPRGVAIAVPDAEEWAEHSRACGGDAVVVSAAEFEDRTGVHVPTGSPVAIEGPPAGFINPRMLVAAQTALADAAGATVIRGVVTNVSGRPGAFTVSGDWGELQADRVLLTTGAFGAELFDRPLDLWRRPRTVVLAEFDDAGSIPSLILDQPTDPRLDEIYWVPPVRYPDGRLCLKIGGDMRPIPDSDPASLIEWFRQGGSADEVDALTNTVRELLPTVEVQSWSSLACVVTHTPTSHPYIGWAEDGVAFALGANGSGAKSSDELGRLAAELVRHQTWTDPDLPEAEFAPQFLKNVCLPQEA